MGKSSKKSASKVDVTAPAIVPATKSGKKGKREPEAVVEKQVNVKKQKRDNGVEQAVQKQKSAAKTQTKKKKVEISSSEDLESSDSEEEEVKVVATKKGGVPAKPLVEDSGSDEDSSSDDEAAADGSELDDGSSDEEDELPAKKAAPKAVPAVTGKKAESSDGSDEDDSDDSEKDEEESDEEEEEEEAAKTPKKKNKDVEMVDAKQPKTPATPQDQSTGSSKTLFVGNLSFNVDQADVEDFFKDAGEIVGIRFSTNEDGRFKGFGHVEFASAEAAKKGLELNGTDLLGRPVRLDLARERGAVTPGKEGNSFQKEGGKGNIQTAFVRGFDTSLGEDEIRSALGEHFGSCGEILRVSIPKDYETGFVKGIAYMDFNSGDNFKKALELNGSELGESYLTVEEAKPKVDGGGRGGGGRSGGGRFGSSGGRFGGRDSGGRSGGRRGGRGGRGGGGRFGGGGRGRY